MSNFFLKKITLASGMALLLNLATLAQQVKFCGNKEANEKLVNNFPAAQQRISSFRQRTAAINFDLLRAAKTTSSAAQYTIPVVFHILHTNGPENIKDAQVIDAVKILNIDFRKLNADTANIVPSFKTLAADCQIEFRLATKDPLGNCTNGIVHHYDVNTQWQGDFLDYIYTWDNTRYLNIYVVATIGFGAAGYTFLPGTAPGEMDAIVILHSYVGSIGTSNTFTSRALTHEVGHWFGLEHVWGGSNNPGVACGDDGIPDTPVTEGHTSCILNSQQCTPGIIENVQNYMEYAYCSNMFTIDQRSLMQNVLNDNGLDRKTLYTPSNLAFTGVTSPVLCSPNADFYSVGNKYAVCAGKTLSFVDFSTNGIPNTYSWSCTGSSTLSAPSASTTNIYFPAPGTYTVTLVTQNSSGAGTAAKTVIAYNSVPNYTTNYQESFETTLIPASWQITNPDAGVTWTNYTTAASNGSKCYFIEGNSNPPDQEDFMQTGIFDLQANPTASLFVDVSYARASASHADIFKVQATKDCGATWLDIYSPGMGNLANQTGGTFTGSFVPISTQWKTVDLHNYPNFNYLVGQPSVSFRFYFKEDPNAGYGNRIFVDNFNFVTSPVGINELSRQLDYQIYPNPNSGVFSVNFVLSDNAKISLKLFDLKGALLFEEKEVLLEPGEHKINPQVNGLEAGVYLVELNYGGTRLVKKLVIQ